MCCFYLFIYSFCFWTCIGWVGFLLVETQILARISRHESKPAFCVDWPLFTPSKHKISDLNLTNSSHMRSQLTHKGLWMASCGWCQQSLGQHWENERGLLGKQANAFGDAMCASISRLSLVKLQAGNLNSSCVQPCFEVQARGCHLSLRGERRLQCNRSTLARLLQNYSKDVKLCGRSCFSNYTFQLLMRRWEMSVKNIWKLCQNTLICVR